MAGLVKAVDEKIAKNSNLKAFVVVLTDDADRTADALKKLAKDKGITHVPLTLIESPSGPPAYQVSADAGVTVLMWHGTEVKVNHAYPQGKMTDADVKAVLSDIPKILD